MTYAATLTTGPLRTSPLTYSRNVEGITSRPRGSDVGGSPGVFQRLYSRCCAETSGYRVTLGG